MRRALKIFGTFLLLVIAVLAAVLWWSRTESALQWLAKAAIDVSNGALRVSGVSGSLYGPLAITELVFEDEDRRLVVKRLALDWSPRALLNRHLSIGEVAIAELEWHTKKGEEKERKPPDRLALPFTFEVETVRINHAVIADAETSHRLDDIAFDASYDRNLFRLRLDSLRFPYGNARAEANLEDEKPFALHGSGNLSGAFRRHEYAADLKLGGELERLQLEANAQSGKANATLATTLLPFSELPLAELELSATEIDAAVFDDQLPRSDIVAFLSARADGEALSGNFVVENRAPGTANEKRIPIQNVRASFAGSKQTVVLDRIEIALNQSGRFSGGGSFDGEKLELDLDAKAVDLRALHTALLQTRLDGGVKLAGNREKQSLAATLTHDGFDIRLLAQHSEGIVSVAHAELKSGKSKLELAGSAALGKPHSFDVKAALESFNPADFGRFPAGRLNATADARGEGDPELRAEVRFAIRDSRWRGVPLTGEGDLTVLGEAIEQVKIAFRAGDNRLALDGAFGRASDILRFSIAAPKLAHLGAPWGGVLNAKGSLRGTMTDALLDVDLSARGLKGPASILVEDLHAVGHASGSLKTPGDFSSLNFSARGKDVSAGPHRVGSFEGAGELREGIDGTVSLDVDAANVESGEFELSRASVKAEGTRRSHRIEATGAGSELDFAAAVKGSVRGERTWAGELLKFTNTGRYPVALLSPATLLVSPPRFSIENADLEVAKGKVSLKTLVLDKDSVESEGGFRAFPVAYAMSFMKQPAFDSDLLVAGKWDFHVGSTLEGEVAVTRESGDITLAKETNLGLTALDFSARARNNRLEARVDAAGSRLGTVVANGDFPLVRQDRRWEIAPGEPLSAALETSMPSIAWLARFAGRKETFDGALTLTARASGSRARPQLSALLTAVRLRSPEAKIDGANLTAELNATPEPGSRDAKVILRVDASAPSYGRISGEARTQVTSAGKTWTVARDAPLFADINADIPSIAFLDVFLPDPVSLGGALSLRAKAGGDLRAPKVSATLNGENLSARSPQTELALKDGTLRATLETSPIDDASNTAVELALDFKAPPYGTVSGNARTRLMSSAKGWRVARDAPIEAALTAAMPTLEWTRAVLPPGVAIGGAFDVKAAAHGTWGEPGLTGTIQGDRFRVQHFDSGLDLKDGVLRAELEENRLLLEQFTMRGGEGTLSAKGSAALEAVSIDVTADKLMVLSRPDRVLALTGDGALALRDKKLSGNAKIRADRALIELPDATEPSLGRDVVVVDDTQPKKTSRARDFSNVDLALQFDLGDDFIVVGKGLDAKLAGLVQLKFDGTPPPTAKGTIRVVKGTYAAYGQRLQIERGVVNFSGPIDNPGLDILAMRKNQPVEAGVAITGTALNPRLTLVSEPVVPDTEKVSWLVLGRGLSGSSKNDLALVQAAAGALLARGQSVSLQQRIAQATGLDEVGISGSGLEGSVLTLGKRLSSRVYLTFERGLTGASNVAKLRYSLTPRWSLETRAGSDTALDLFYTLSFD